MQGIRAGMLPMQAALQASLGLHTSATEVSSSV